MWHQMMCLSIIVDRQEGESSQSYNWRKQKAKRHFMRPEISRVARREIFVHGHLPKDSTAWADLDTSGTSCVCDLDASRVKSDPATRHKVAGMVFIILAYLNNMARDDPQAAGVANSIWQSVRADYAEDSQMMLPDIVSNELFMYEGVLLNSFGALQLDKTAEGSLRQVWFIDRIMRHGKLWIGSYKRCIGSYKRAQKVEERTEQSPKHDLSTGEEEHEASTSEMGGKRPVIVSAASSTGARPRLRGHGIIHRQQVRQVLSKMLDYSDFMTSGGKDESTHFGVGSLLNFVELSFRETWTAEAEEARVRDLVSVFDVDGPCMVATPYNGEWESLPHPPLRSMSTCWVVEKVNCDTDPAAEGSQVSIEECKGKGKEISVPVNEDFAPESEARGSEEIPQYRVLNKVKGLWQLMETP